MNWFKKDKKPTQQQDTQIHTTMPDKPTRTIITSKGRVVGVPAEQKSDGRDHAPVFPLSTVPKRLVHKEEVVHVHEDEPDPLDSLVTGIALGEILAGSFDESSSSSSGSDDSFSGSGGSFGGGGSDGSW